MPVHYKLVRDRIPEVIEKTGKKFTTKIMDKEEYIVELRKKAFEELEEYMNTENDADAVEELADLLEIIHAMADIHNVSFAEIEDVRKNKAEKHGGFKEGIFLIEVEDE